MSYTGRSQIDQKQKWEKQRKKGEIAQYKMTPL